METTEIQLLNYRLQKLAEELKAKGFIPNTMKYAIANIKGIYQIFDEYNCPRPKQAFLNDVKREGLYGALKNKLCIVIVNLWPR